METVVPTQAPATADAPVVDGTLGTVQAPIVGTVEAPVVENAGSIQAPVVTTPVAQTPTVETPDKPAAPESPAATTPAATPDATQEEETVGGLGDILEAPPGSDEPEAEDNRKPKPLVDVADAVKRSMCQVAARKAMEKSLAKASVLVQVHFEKMMRWEEYNKKKGDPPEALDLEAMAAKYGLVFSQTGMVDDVQVLEDPIGRLGVPMDVQRNGRRQRTVVPVGQLVFNDFGNIRMFDAQTVNDLWGSQDLSLIHI